MDSLYDRIDKFCKDKGVNITQMCREAGVSRGNLTDLKKGRQASLSPQNLLKIAGYFEITIEELLGEGKKKEPAPKDGDGRIDRTEFINSLTDDELLMFIAEASRKLQERRQ